MDIDNLYRKPAGTLGAIVRCAPIDSLVFEGGGPKGLVYVGAVDVLAERGMLATVRNVGGSSAGAMTALAVGLGLGAERIREVSYAQDIGGLTDLRPADEPEIAGAWGALRDVEAALSNLLTTDARRGRGLFLGDALQAWFRGLVMERVADAVALEGDAASERARFAAALAGKGSATFAELAELASRFPELGVKRMAFTGTNYTDQTLDVFSADTTPEMPVDLAVRISSSLPWFFKSVKYAGKEYMDGGALDNYPMGIFDRPPYLPAGCSKLITGAFGQNLCTLGFRVDSHEEMRRVLWEGANRDESGFLSRVVKGVGNAVLDLCAGADVSAAAAATDQATYGRYAQRTVQIPDLGYSTFDFSLGDEDKDRLVQSGEQATREWLALYYDDTGIELELDSLDELAAYVGEAGLARVRERFPALDGQ